MNVTPGVRSLMSTLSLVAVHVQRMDIRQTILFLTHKLATCKMDERMQYIAIPHSDALAIHNQSLKLFCISCEL